MRLQVARPGLRTSAVGSCAGVGGAGLASPFGVSGIPRHDLRDRDRRDARETSSGVKVPSAQGVPLPNSKVIVIPDPPP